MDRTHEKRGRVTRCAGLLFAALCATQALAEPAVRVDTFRFPDGGAADFHEIVVGDAASVDTIVFTYGGSGCIDLGRHWLPRVASGMGIQARFLSLNKRHVGQGQDSGGSGEGCSPAFNAHDVPRQWMGDYMAFVSRKLGEAPDRWKNVVLVGASEGGALAARVARSRTDVTHLVVVGDGGWSMRDILASLVGPGAVDDAWRDIAGDPDSPDRMWMGHSHRYWFDVFDHAPLRDYLALDIPVLIGFGERDRSVPLASAQDVLRSARAAGKRNIGLVVYPGADHGLRVGEHDYLGEFLRGAGQGIAAGDMD